MPALVFERTRLSVALDGGGSVAEVCDDNILAGVPFSCRHANCGTCRVEVTEGLELCEPRGADELRIAEVFGDPETVRLACRLKIRSGDGTVRLRVMLRVGR